MSFYWHGSYAAVLPTQVSVAQLIHTTNIFVIMSSSKAPGFKLPQSFVVSSL